MIVTDSKMHSDVADCWIGVALDSQIRPASSHPVIVNGIELAVWRGQEGDINVWQDRCPHRGMRLSFGFVRGNTLRCLYHGWGYETDGQCSLIPATPELTPPRTICVRTFNAKTQYGIAWTNLAEVAEVKLPDIDGDGDWLPVRSIVINRDFKQVQSGILDSEPGSYLEPNTPLNNVIIFDFEHKGRLLIALQSVTPCKTALHTSFCATENTVEYRRHLACRLERMRNEIEASNRRD